MGKVTLDIVVAGACGRMGVALLTAAFGAPGIRVAGALEAPGHPKLGRDAGEVCGLGTLGARLESDPFKALARGAVLVDFTSPQATLKHLEAARALKKKAVIGTTGFKPAQQKVLQAFAKASACVVSSNFSVGVNLLWKALEVVARKTGDDFEVEIIEAHHHDKKDAPSGTALATAQVLAAALGRDLDKVARFGRGRGIIGPRPPREIGIHAVRAGDIVGDHTVLFAGQGERLEFIHRAHTRENLAAGALKAAAWVSLRKPGLYSMRDVLGL